MLIDQYKHKIIGIAPIELKYANIALSIEMNDRIAISNYLKVQSQKYDTTIKHENKEEETFMSKYFIISEDNQFLIVLRIFNSFFCIASSFFYAFEATVKGL
jgi:hypothetical protein